MHGVLTAEAAVLVHFQSVRIVLLVLHGVVVALLALGAGQGNFDSHFGTSHSLKAGFCEPPSSRLADGAMPKKGHKKINPL